MIDAVGTWSVQSAALRGNPQNAVSFASATGNSGADLYANMPKLGTRLYVRIDSAAERAILEVRSSDTGEVVNQYPSEAQIKAFQRAEKLAAARAEQEAARAARAATTGRDIKARPQQHDTQAPAPVQPASAHETSVIAPVSDTPAVPETSASGSGESGQSIFA